MKTITAMTKTPTRPRLQDLPPPPQGKTGWPWTEEVDRSGVLVGEHHSWPWISVLIPSYNYGQFIEETIRSILLQTYPYIECIVIDGGSTDQTIEIIKKYEPYLAYWESQPDRGQTDAINRGYVHCTGDIFVWLCADDFYYSPCILQKVAKLYLDGYNFIAGQAYNINLDGTYRYEAITADGKPSPTHFNKYLRYWSSTFLQQPAVFVAKGLADSCFPLSTDLNCAMDYQFFLRVLKKKPTSIWVPERFVKVRWHELSKSTSGSLYSAEVDTKLLEEKPSELHYIALAEAKISLNSLQCLIHKIQAFDYLHLSRIFPDARNLLSPWQLLWHASKRPTVLHWPRFWKLLSRKLLGTEIYTHLKKLKLSKSL